MHIDIPAGSPFSIDNVPFGVIHVNDTLHCATAIGDFALDLALYSQAGRLDAIALSDTKSGGVLSQHTLNAFAALPIETRRAVRRLIQDDIRNGNIQEEWLTPLKNVKMALPMHIGGYSDFYCSLEHCRNCSTTMAANNIPKNWFYAPSVYNSRVSSIIPSPHPIRRPKGVYFENGIDSEPTYGPSQSLDFELEMGYFVSKPVPYGETLDIESAKDHIFGFVLLNDWSARDLQVFEMRPLGPFHGKGFGTSISPWIVTLDALEQFSCDPKTKQDPSPFAHLQWPHRGDGALDIKLRVTLIRNGKRHQLAVSNLRYLYWTPYQQITHHASAMCGLETGDLMGTGTISGSATDTQGNKLELGCLYETTQAGTRSVSLDDGTILKYLEDGDEIVLEGWCGGTNADGSDKVLGFGVCEGKVLP